MNRSILLALVTPALLVSAAGSSSAQSGDGFLFHRPDVSVSPNKVVRS